MRAAAGSAHYRPKNALSSNPASRMADRYVQNSVCLASACMAALPRAFPPFAWLWRAGHYNQGNARQYDSRNAVFGSAAGPQVQHGFLSDVGATRRSNR